MSIDRDDGTERQARVDRMITEFRQAQSGRFEKPDPNVGESKPEAGLNARRPGTATPVADRPTAIFQMEPERRGPRVPAEYRSLYTYLDHRYASIVVLTFEQIEALLGFTLPVQASIEPEWWTDVAVSASRHSEAWLEAGRTATPSLAARTVRFERLP